MAWLDLQPPSRWQENFGDKTLPERQYKVVVSLLSGEELCRFDYCDAAGFFRLHRVWSLGDLEETALRVARVDLREYKLVTEDGREVLPHVHLRPSGPPRGTSGRTAITVRLAAVRRSVEQVEWMKALRERTKEWQTQQHFISAERIAERMALHHAELQDLPQEAWEDREVLLMALAHPRVHGGAQLARRLVKSQSPLLHDREVVMQLAKCAMHVMQHLPEEFKSDEEVVLCYISRNPGAVRHAAPALRASAAFWKKAVICNEQTIQFAGPEVLQNRELLLEVLPVRASALQFLSEEMKADKELVLCAVRRQGRALGFAAVVLRRDREVVLAAVQQSGQALPFADETLQTDTEVVLAALPEAPKEILLKAVGENPELFQQLPEALQKDEELRATHGQCQTARSAWEGSAATEKEPFLPFSGEDREEGGWLNWSIWSVPMVS
ncbi:unnamed protein product [Durusdinium trenchii]|uniref:Uncharacterized protein n=2 Tax=Durusdinium trenchii TaxID=1381693 RepID=A0ABP0I0D6_9DINO